MSTPRPATLIDIASGLRRVGALVAFLVVLLPVAGLLWAGERARETVIERVQVGQAATAQSIAVQVETDMANAAALSQAAAARRDLLVAIDSADRTAVTPVLENILVTGPFVSVVAYDITGRRIASAGAPGASRLSSVPPARVTGEPVITGDDATILILEPLPGTGTRVGTLAVHVSFARALPDMQRLSFGESGRTAIVAEDSTYLMVHDPALHGMQMTTPESRALAAGHIAGAAIAYSQRQARDIVTNYAPVAGTTMGVVTRQFESEAFASAEHLRSQLRIAAGVSLLLGVALLLVGTGILRRYRALLDKRDEELRRVVTRSRDILVRLDADRRVTFISPAVNDILGYTPVERVGRDQVELVHPDDREAYLGDIARHRSDDTMTLRCRMLHRDGRALWVETTSVTDRRPDGSIAGYDETTRDITFREQARIELAAARDEALAASQAKSVFLANTSHELRTPLNGILGLTEVMLGGNLDGQQRKYARTVQDSGHRLLRILDDILDLAKVEAGKVELESTPFALSAAVEQAVGPFRPSAEAKGLALHVDVAADLPTWVLGDPTRFAQVVSNLVSNAVKFTATGAVRVSVGHATQSGAADMIHVTVEDDGIGIAPEGMEHLFEPFTQADSSTTRRYGGTGLGLAVSRQLAELQGGSLEVVASRPGMGSIFTFRIPLPAVADPNGDRDVHESGTPQVTRSLQVLVAEDEAVNQMVVTMMLTRLGHHAVVVANGREAVAAVLDGPVAFDVVLMDCHMPVLDGYAATTAIRNGQHGGRRTPVVGLSAAAMAEDREQGLAAGMDLYLTKPIRMHDLAAALSSATQYADTMS